MKTRQNNKRQRDGFDIKTFHGESGKDYIVFKTTKGAFLSYQKCIAKKAAQDCGAQGPNTRQMWKSVWKDNN